MSAWKCEKCGWEGRTTQKSGHKAYRCPMQGNLLLAMRRQEKDIANEAARAEEAERKKAEAKPAPTFYQYLSCVCGCGTTIGQVKGQKKRQFVDNEHYEKWRRDRDRAADGTEDGVVAKRKHAEEVAALTEKDAAIARAAEAVPLLSPDASFALWMRCLGLNSDDGSTAAA